MPTLPRSSASKALLALLALAAAVLLAGASVLAFRVARGSGTGGEGLTFALLGAAFSVLALAGAVTRQRKAVDALQESERRYRTLIEQFPDAVILRDDLRVRYANPAAVKLTGAQDASQLEGMSLYQLLPTSSSGSGEFPNLAGDLPSHRRRTLFTLDGRQLPVEVTDIAVVLEGRPQTLDVLRDLSLREALQRSEEDFRRFFDLAPLALLLSVLEDGRVLRANQAARDLFELEGEDPAQFRTPDFYANLADRSRIVEQVRAKGRLDGVELDVITVKGRARRLLLSTTPIRFEGRQVLLTGYMDLTSIRKTEEALRQAQKMESLGLLAGGVAHDFNNLLTALTGNLEIVRSMMEGHEEAQPFLDNMSSTLHRAADLARQMLAYAGRSHLRMEPVDINRLLQEQARILSVSLSKKVELRFELAPGLPLIEGDPAQIRQVFMNLVTNASDAIGDREGTIVLRTRLDYLGDLPEEETLPGSSMQTGTHVLVEVSDTGQGMSPEIQARIFDPFFTTKPTGRGLGLSTMLGILRSHRAGVRIESEEGKGTTFRLYFPLAGVGRAEAPAEEAKPGRKRFEGTVLLVDDEEGIRQSAGALLRMLGFGVVEAGDGREALAKLDEMVVPPSLVLLDLSMPRMDGAETLERLRTRYPDLPVVLCSGYDAKQAVPRLMELGTVRFLQKPYHLASLQETVADALGAKG
ncbi:MAG TPA: response regulator [Holophagaceae bacterium]|nr:response regulator [Holophagaceae bacterium]